MMPGFTAEASFYGTKNGYHMDRTSGVSDAMYWILALVPRNAASLRSKWVCTALHRCRHVAPHKGMSKARRGLGRG